MLPFSCRSVSGGRRVSGASDGGEDRERHTKTEGNDRRATARVAPKDVGRGITERILAGREPATIHGVDQSQAYVDHARDAIKDTRASFDPGNAESLPFDDGRFDAAVSGLVLNFVPDHGMAFAEMRRVTVPGGVVAAYVWDYAGKMEMMRYFWDAAAELDWLAQAADEPFLSGQGPAPAYNMSLSEEKRGELRELIRSRLPIKQDGSIHLVARAWAARGRV